MKSSHNKKRNVGVIYELLLRYVSDRLVSGNNSDAQVGLNIIEKYFNEGTELYKEFRLFNALAKSTVSTTTVAAAILTEAKGAARRCNSGLLDIEKSGLIREINYNIDDKEFYHRRIPDYKMYATIQTLLNEWRRGDLSNLSMVAVYESRVVENLLEENKDKDPSDYVDPNIDNLVVKIMTEKFNKKYREKLNEEQKDIIKTYVFSMSNDNGVTIRERLTRVKTDTISQLDELRGTSSSAVILEKISDVKKNILEAKMDTIDDSCISRFLLISKLKFELME
tara:strand:+ start:7422 stop:8264 length:843 start_codon:yes stop_codon:yes gene_type:complete